MYSSIYMKANFILKTTGQPPQGFDTLPLAFVAAHKIRNKSSVIVEGPFNRSYDWDALLKWAKDADIIDRDGNINKRALKRK